MRWLEILCELNPNVASSLVHIAAITMITTNSTGKVMLLVLLACQSACLCVGRSVRRITSDSHEMFTREVSRAKDQSLKFEG